MWTKLLIFGVASSLLTGIAGCTKITGVPEIRHAYINLTDKPVIIQSFWTNYPASGETQEPYPVQTEDSIAVQDTLYTYSSPEKKDSVFVIFNKKRILKWYPNSREEEYSLYNFNNYEYIQDPYPLCIYRFIEKHWEIAEETKTE